MAKVEKGVERGHACMYSHQIISLTHIYLLDSEDKSLRGCAVVVVHAARNRSCCSLQSSIMAVLAAGRRAVAQAVARESWRSIRDSRDSPQLRRACTETEREVDRIESNLYMLLLALQEREKGGRSV